MKDCCHTKSLKERRGRVKFRECVREHDWIRNISVDHPGIRSTVADLIGEPVRCDYYRELYPTFHLRGKPGIPGGHRDRHPFQVGAVIYIDDVEPGGGGFVVWPGSHRILATEAWDLTITNTPPSYETARREMTGSEHPVEISGPRGTVIWWHQKLLHAAGANRSRRVRHAILRDFMNRDYQASLRETCDLHPAAP